MWFKNLTLFRLAESFSVTAEELSACLRKASFQPCASRELISYGWVTPLGPRASEFVHASTGYMLFCLQAEERILPGAVVRDAVQAKVAEIEERQGRQVRPGEKRSIREEVLYDMVPRAFTRRRQTYAYIDPRRGWLIIDGVGRRMVEELTRLLRDGLGSLPIRPPAVVNSPAMVMTSWLDHGDLMAGFVLGEECELRDGREAAGIVRCRGQDLSGPEIQAHLQAGKQATRLALIWNERIAFILGEDLSIRKLRFLDLVKEQLDSGDDDTAEAVFDAQFILMCEELSQVLPAMLEAFGGENSSL